MQINKFLLVGTFCANTFFSCTQAVTTFEGALLANKPRVLFGAASINYIIQAAVIKPHESSQFNFVLDRHVPK